MAPRRPRTTAHMLATHTTTTYQGMLVKNEPRGLRPIDWTEVWNALNWSPRLVLIHSISESTGFRSETTFSHGGSAKFCHCPGKTTVVITVPTTRRPAKQRPELEATSCSCHAAAGRLARRVPGTHAIEQDGEEHQGNAALESVAEREAAQPAPHRRPQPRGADHGRHGRHGDGVHDVWLNPAWRL